MTAIKPDKPSPLFAPAVDLPEMKLAKLREQYEREAKAARKLLAGDGYGLQMAGGNESDEYERARAESERMERELK